MAKIVKTLNKHGYAIEKLDPISERFIEASAEAAEHSELCLELGAAFGFTTLEALKHGAKIIANDISGEHLKAIEKRTPKGLAPNLSLLKGAFPSDIRIEDNSIRHVLICRVTHYFNPTQMDDAIVALYKMLKPGGKVFLVSESPYGVAFRKFIPVYDARLKEKTDLWPGYIDNLSEYMEQFSEDNQDTMLLLGERELEEGFKRGGFNIEHCRLFSRKGTFPDELCFDGRESVGLVAMKPQMKSGL